MLEDTDFFADHFVATERENGLPKMRITDLRSGQTHYSSFPNRSIQPRPTQNAEFNTRVFASTISRSSRRTPIYDYDMDEPQARVAQTDGGAGRI